MRFYEAPPAVVTWLTTKHPHCAHRIAEAEGPSELRGAVGHARLESREFIRAVSKAAAKVEV